MRILTVYTGIMLIIFLFLYLKPIPLSEQVHLETTEEEVTFLNDIGVPNPLDFTSLMVDFAQSYGFSRYLQALEQTLYITPSYNPVIFQRDWMLSQQLIYDQTSSINVKGYLFKDDNDHYYLMIDYRMRYNEAIVNMSYLTINTSNDIDYWVDEHDAAIHVKGQEYRVGGTVGEAYGSSYYFKPYHLSTIHPTMYQGIMIIEFLDISEYLHVDIDVYEAVYQTSSHTLGFNQINTNQAIKYIPQSIELIYEREANE